MKRYKILIVVLVLFTLFGCGETYKKTCFVRDPEVQRLPSPSTFLDLLFGLKTPELICYTLSSEVRPEPDHCYADEYRTPRQTWELRYGDCEDYAIFTAYFLSKIFIRYTLVNVVEGRYCHAICVWEQDGKYRYSSNGEIKGGYFNSITDAVTYSRADWTHYYTYTLDNVVYNSTDTTFIKKVVR